MSDAFETVRDALSTGGASFTDTRQNHFMATCPAHADKNPSLGVDDRDDRVMLRCYAGCHNDDVVAAMGLEFKDLFDGELESSTKDRHKGLLIRSYLYETANGQPWFYVDKFWPKTYRQRLPDQEPCRDLGDREATKRLGLRGRAPILYHLPRLWRGAQAGKEVWWVDGEKDVETAERHGLVATSPPGFAKWEEDYAKQMKALGVERVVLVVDQDKEKPNGELGSGQSNAVQARNGLRTVGISVRMVSPKVGKDLTDHFTAGFGVDDFEHEKMVYTRPRGLAADALMTHEFEEVQWAIPQLLPSGLAIVAGSPKAGKSWVALDLCLSVAAGGRALSYLPAVEGSALYLAREDTYRRLQSRMRLLMESSTAPAKLELVPQEQEWIGGEEGLANLTEWAEEVGDARLVVIDTLAKVEPDMGETRTRGAYSGNYSMMARYKAWADLHNCAVVMIHHDNKTKADKTDGWLEDPFTQISGTRGLTGAADTLWFLETHRFSQEGRLHITGRDVAEQSLELRRVGPLWTCTSVPE